MLSISEKLSQIHQRIECAVKQSQKNKHVQLLCVSKTKPVEAIEEAYLQGERHFGESYAVEASEKIETLRNKGYNDICWHFIGPIQKNKTKLIAEHFDIVESVDREIIVDRLSEQRPTNMKPLEILIEVNISGEEQKSGCLPEEIEKIAAAVVSKPNLHLKGLMGIAKDTADKNEIEQSFTNLNSLFEKLKTTYPDVNTLSMGMTHDLEQAVACGSTEVRIGTAIFGAREYRQGRADTSVAFIGGGNMASCIFESVIKSLSPRNVTVSGPHIEKLEHFKVSGAGITTDNILAAKKSKIIFLGVKPQMLTAVLQELADAKIDFEEKLVISMAAGYPLKSIEKILNSSRLVRIMPNTPAKIGEGVTAVTFAKGCADPDKELVRLLLKGMGTVCEGNERQLNVIGAVAGCGPAFVYRFMEALISESVRHGLDEKDSRAMVEQLFKGTADMVINNQQQSIAALREAVTSKGGTTFAGLTKMSEGGFEEMMQKVIQASLDRTAEFESMF
ncbi:MAG TPA: hypothetical protein DCL74_06875 [Succinivibrionaceae bacterium]|nr:hypothetical protein [Succinivibrionaceae bacterium]